MVKADMKINKAKMRTLGIPNPITQQLFVNAQRVESRLTLEFTSVTK